MGKKRFQLSGVEDSETEEVKLSSSIHLPVQTFKPIDLAFNLALAPREGTRSRNGGIIEARTLLAKFLSSVI